MKASDVLRERANDRVGVDPHELHAIADLLDACVEKTEHQSGAVTYQCMLCAAWMWQSEEIRHTDDCALIAVERAFPGESDA